MTQPLALILYEKLLPGSQLVNRLQDLNYRVQAVSHPDSLVGCAEAEMPMVVVVDLTSTTCDVPALISKMKQNPGTSHIPVIAFGPEAALDSFQAALNAGAALVTGEVAILSHVSELLEQALHVD
ncbi:MAG: hypothetical protein U1F65_00150 [Verrucomicrobiota bacterium]